MKVKIDENSNFVCPEYLTVGKVYDAINTPDDGFGPGFWIRSDDDKKIFCLKYDSDRLSGGNWTEVK